MLQVNNDDQERIINGLSGIIGEMLTQAENFPSTHDEIVLACCATYLMACEEFTPLTHDDAVSYLKSVGKFIIQIYRNINDGVEK